MKAFENFDWDAFWYNDSNSYKLIYFNGGVLKEQDVKRVEDEFGYKLPDSYIELLSIQNGGAPFYSLFYYEKDEEFVPVYLTAIYGVDSKLEYSICGDSGAKMICKEWGYPDIGLPIALTTSDGNEVIFLDYSECGTNGEPKVVLVDQANDYKKTLLAENFENFIKGLRKYITVITIDEFKSLDEDEQAFVIDRLNDEFEIKRVIEYLNGMGIENLNSRLLGALARAYNNDRKFKKAIEIMDRIPESDRDAIWYYRYGYTYTYRRFPNIEKYMLKALAMFDKAVDITKDKKVVDWCIEPIETSGIEGFLMEHKTEFPMIYKEYVNYKKAKVDKYDDFDPEYEKRWQYTTRVSKKLAGHYDVNWIFDQHKYSRYAFAVEFDDAMIENFGEDWHAQDVNASIDAGELLVVYKAYIKSTKQLHENEILFNDAEVLEEKRNDGMWQVKIMGYLKSDDGICFSLEELMFKIHNLMANKELGDFVKFEGFDNIGFFDRQTGKEDRDNGLPTLYVCLKK